MAIATGARYLEHLVRFLERNAGPLVDGTMTLKLNPVGLHYVQSRLEALRELEGLITGAPVDYLRAYVSDLGDHRAIEQLRRMLGLLRSLKVISALQPPARDPTPLSLLPFGRLKVLELRGCDLSSSAARGLLELRHTLEKLICHNSTDALRHVFAGRIIDIKDSPVWKKLSFVSCACNNLVLMDESLQLLPVVETLDLSRNQFAIADNLRKCTKLKHLDLGFNHLRSISLLSEVFSQIVKVVLRNNALTTLRGIEKLKSLEGLDISYNIISSFKELEILRTLSSLQNLWLEGNPICSARWYRAHVFSFFMNLERLKLDDKIISKSEYWERHVICASRQKKPAGYGFYFPAKDEPEEEESTTTKRKKYSRLVSIEDEEQRKHAHSVTVDQESVSHDSDNARKDIPTTSHVDSKIVGLINRVENMKKEHSIFWLREFKDYMVHEADDIQDDIDSEESSLGHDKEKYLKLKKSQKSFCGISADAYGFKSPESGSGSDFFSQMDNYGVGSQTTNGTLRVKSMLPNGENISVTESIGLFSEKDNMKTGLAENLSSSEVDVFLDHNSSGQGGNHVEADPISETSTVINEILDMHTPSTYPRSPPHYQADILKRRLFLEKEFFQLSTEPYNAESSDSDTSTDSVDSYESSSSGSDLENALVRASIKRGFTEYLSVPNGRESHINGTLSEPSTREKIAVSDDHRDQQLCAGTDVFMSDVKPSIKVMSDTNHRGDKQILSEETGEIEKRKGKRRVSRRIISLSEVPNGDPKSTKPSAAQTSNAESNNTYNHDLCDQVTKFGKRSNTPTSSQLSGSFRYIVKPQRSYLEPARSEYVKNFFQTKVVESRVSETCEGVVLCCCILQHESIFQEREVAILRSSLNKLYMLLIDAAPDDQDMTCNLWGSHKIEDLREVVIGLGLQAVRLYLEDDTTYILLTKTAERSQDLLLLLQLCGSVPSTEVCYLNSWEQVQVELLEKYVNGGLRNNIYMYSMLMFWHQIYDGEAWLMRSLVVIEGYILLFFENLAKFGSFTDDSGLSSPYYSLDSCCHIQNIVEMVVDGSNFCSTLTIYNAVSVAQQSTESQWKLKWYNEDSLANFVALVKAIHLEETSSPIPVKFINEGI